MSATRADRLSSSARTGRLAGRSRSASASAGFWCGRDAPRATRRSTGSGPRPGGQALDGVGAAEHGVPAEVIGLLAYLFATIVDGREAHTADGVGCALGRESRDLADFARRTAATGVWHV